MKAVRMFSKGRQLVIWWAAFLVILIADSTAGREINPKIIAGNKHLPASMAASTPIVYSAHNRGNIQLAIANNGTFGTLGGTIPDPFTGEVIPSCIYPKGSNIIYLWVAAVWIGAVVQRDTLVSCANEDWWRTLEFWPSTDFVYKSMDINSSYYDPDANSEQDILCEYTDTTTSPNLVGIDPTDNRSHKPLNVKVTQRSMAWSYSYANDFILFDFQVQNIGVKNLRDVYIGIYVDGDVHHTTAGGGYNDDIVGFYPTHPALEGCGFIDTVNIAYTIDNDGDPSQSGHWDNNSARGAVGVRVVRTPSTSLKYSYNWWITNYSDATRDFGPRRQGTADDPYRYFGSRLGTPEGDRNKYYVLSHEEFDYDLLFTAVDHTSEGWLPPPSYADSIATGFDARYLLSFGPFDISPGQRLPVSFAWVGGENVHVNPSDYKDLFEGNQHDPWPYYRSLDFSDLANNSRWASWVYDNPGVDTDGDDYYGPERICCDSITGICDTSYAAGDGVPDFRAAGPPPAPKLRVIPSEGKLIVRWNGFYSETTPDMFSRIIDFEGYRVHIGRDNRPASFSVVASYDREDYNRYRYEQSGGGSAGWILEEIPFTIDSLRRMFSDPDFDPLIYTRENPFEFEGENYFFDAQDYNTSSLSSVFGIHKVYPDAVNPSPDPYQWRSEDVTEEHGIPLPKFYEYEYVIDSLLSLVPYNVAVTCFDFGSPLVNLTALETDPTNNTLVAYPQATADTVEAYGLDVYVYPNPYSIEGQYRALGFEGRLEPDRPHDRVRALHFANLPAKCTISIFSLDGDLIKKIVHDKDPSDPQSSHNQWNLISRNFQAVVSGLYYYVVESEGRTQIGKLAIIR